MRVNGWVYRYIRRPCSGNQLKVHLGPGQKNYLKGWLNCDANMFTGKCDLWVDLRHPLPFLNESVDAVYSHHVVEHLPNLRSHLSEIYRILKPGGVLRVGGPHGDNAIRKFMENDLAWFGNWPDNRRSIGGRFENFIFCRGEHLTILTVSFLTELLEDAGFADICLCRPMLDTTQPNLFADCLRIEFEDDPKMPHTLIFEAIKRKDHFVE